MKSVIGIDPGGRSTGIVLANGAGRLIDAEVITRKGTGRLPDPAYLLEIKSEISFLVAGEATISLIAVEGLSAPTGFRRGGGKEPISPFDLVGPAMVLGMILAQWPGAIVVPPNGNGSKPFFAYPEEIRPKPGGKGSDKLRHARSAWDVAISGVSLEVLRSAQARSTIRT